ncbi:hypothetical protein TRFO_06187 [Tritrichomonas foetus]|uniref:Uncharacterized protein n=1 Tax=Tritrichomonas foetus TaxID=1144522 RepID=A0A1J4K1T7_9EUKA|nr:hypothetical protein TRFO_06187 [Tritrichomonas foetus]|eukprot:OHT04752.1 hypothetical protein TRFO_06187 [Tritrichomonas foetus]
MSASRTILPPISSFASTMPVINLDLPSIDNRERAIPSLQSNIPNPSYFNNSPETSSANQSTNTSLTYHAQPNEPDYESNDEGNDLQPTSERSSARNKMKPSQFTIEEDLAIVKCVFAYYKSSWNQKIPWSFWQVYRKTTGSQRSNSSLYHHWEGAICKKYGIFLNNSRLQDCINFIETQIQMDKGLNYKSASGFSSGTPLSTCRAQTQLFQETSNAPQPLMRNFSMPGFAVNQPFYQPMFY